MTARYQVSRNSCAILLLVLQVMIGVNTVHASNSVCRIVPLLPGTPDDPTKAQTSRSYCEIDFSQPSVAVCPKNWSTSAAMLVYDLSGTAWEGRNTAFEAEVCPEGKHARDRAKRELAVFKHSMNFRDTSGTYAPAILLYDHFSRWLGTVVQVPAAAELRFDKAWYAQRVVAPGLALAEKHPSRQMLLAAWQHLQQDVTSRDDVSEFTLRQPPAIWGAALLFTGSRYGAEINGTRESGWGKGQNLDFQQTAPFLALRHPEKLMLAVDAGIAQARANPVMSEAVADDISRTQVAWWMLELLDIIILDYLLGQQDRVGNIDYQWRWLWLQNNTLHSEVATGSAPLVSNAVRLRTTWLNDNDAGVRAGYANYARTTAMLKNLQHFNPVRYQRLKALARDLETQGPMYQALLDNYHLSKREVLNISTRADEIARIITADCKAGKYRFDLTPDNVLEQRNTATEIACD
ncbi:hypothetical protein A3709_02245 [Halioglobus sp. HI00S01]|uniref:hypothetical protein n=1 Tax=Halioglobus sp. HI00S01 TaxID=1822214 RepID=UPI0007C3F883|nr:hypothetical protein [Halioglobus sp. HI00S01]KZX58305.1 hypothetical protein A3709_02245 [Halioglobus sp. HI00S01]